MTKPVNSDEIIDLYLQNKLTGERLNEFEIRLLDDPKLLHEVQLREVMISEIKLSKRGPQQEELPQETISNILRPTFNEWIQQPMSIAASLVFCIGILSVYLQPNSADYVQHSIENVNVASVDLIERMRNSNNLQSVSGEFPKLLQIDASFASRSSLARITIEDSEGNIVAESQNARIDNEGWVRIVLQEELSGHYFLTLSYHENDSEELGSSRFDLNFGP